MAEMQENTENTAIDFAPWLAIPSDRVVNVEHPGIVKDIEAGILSLGGERNVANVRFQCSDVSTPLSVISLSYKDLHKSITSLTLISCVLSLVSPLDGPQENAWPTSYAVRPLPQVHLIMECQDCRRASQDYSPEADGSATKARLEGSLCSLMRLEWVKSGDGTEVFGR